MLRRNMILLTKVSRLWVVSRIMVKLTTTSSWSRDA